MVVLSGAQGRVVVEVQPPVPRGMGTVLTLVEGIALVLIAGLLGIVVVELFVALIDELMEVELEETGPPP